jgi:hypothetical protein
MSSMQRNVKHTRSCAGCVSVVEASGTPVWKRMETLAGLGIALLGGGLPLRHSTETQVRFQHTSFKRMQNGNSVHGRKSRGGGGRGGTHTHIQWEHKHTHTHAVCESVSLCDM